MSNWVSHYAGLYIFSIPILLTLIVVAILYLTKLSIKDHFSIILLVFLVSTLLNFMAYICFDSVTMNKQEVEGYLLQKQNLVAIKTNEGTSSSINIYSGLFLMAFSGQIDSTTYYNYMIQKDSGAFVLQKLKANGDVEIYETNSEKPRMEEYSFRYADPWARDHFRKQDMSWTHQFRFYVPVGTVQKGFNVTP